MRRDDVRRALEAAKLISNHHEFVIAGSLSILGVLDVPPEKMSHSIDIDFYPLRDPGRASDIAKKLGENSDFHESNGYYLDAISPILPILPDKWQERMVKINLGQVSAYFLDVHDTAVSKYARGAQNDYKWLESGYENKILNIDTIEARVRFSTEYLNGDEKQKTMSGLLMHRLATRPNETFDMDLLNFLQSNLCGQKIIEIDLENGKYAGPILWMSDEYAIQSIESNIVAHRILELNDQLLQGDNVIIHYRNGKPTISNNPMPAFISI